MSCNIHAVIVTFKPNILILKKCIVSLIDQVNKIYIIDNTPFDCIELKLYSYEKEKIEIIYLHENKGIAYAQNIGIKKAIDNGADYILTSDQDTIYPENYINDMILIFKKYNKQKVAAVAPFFRDVNSNNQLMPIMIYNKNKIIRKRMFNEIPEEIYSVSHVISSGMIIKKDALLCIGLMDVVLFIDWVDTEWCFRANTLGYNIIQTSNVIITHQHGDYAKKIFNYTLTKHNYIRRYYRIRNGVFLLLNNKYLNKSMKKYIIEELIKMVIMHFFQANNIINEIYNKYYAFKDGINKNLGKLRRNLKES